MKGRVFALMVHERTKPCETLKPVLKRLGVDTFSVSSCADAARLLEQTEPLLLFTDTVLPDGTWKDVLHIAEGAAASLCSILVADSKDPELLQTARNYGAFDCLLPPFEAEAVSELLQRAVLFVRANRERNARSAVA